MKPKTKILRTLVLLIGLSFLTACGGDGMGGTGIEPGSINNPNPTEGDNNNPPTALTTISRVTIPFREHGYSNFETLIFNSREEFNDFISDVNGQDSWNNKTSFLQQIQSVTIDFTKQNLLLYRITESSGSVNLTPKQPALINNKTTIVIDRQVPAVGTADVAYYGLAYQVDKSITEVIFDNGSSQTPVDLTSTPTPTVEGRLVRSSASSLLAYFQESIKRNSTNSNGNTEEVQDGFSVAAPTANVGSGSEGNAGISSTNIQELGVDEADLIKTNGRYIYSVKKPTSFTDTPDILTTLPTDTSTDISFAPANSSTPSDSIRIMDTQGEMGLTEIKNLSDADKPWNIAGLYLHDDRNRLVALSSEKQNYYANWFDSYYFSNQNTDIFFIDVTDPSTASVVTKLSFDGQLIDSRRNGNTLYMVLRDYPDYQYIDEPSLAATTNSDFLPNYTIGDSTSQPISPPENCFVEEGNETNQGAVDIITLVAVDLSSVTPQINSHCYVGSAEAIYASQNALYLATTRWNYQSFNGIAEYNNQVTTDIHKFAYNGLNFDYRGSGEVDGHLGFRQSSKSFRFSENEGLLRVVTFDEDQWSALPVASVATEPALGETTNQIIDQSPVSLSILKDDPTTRSLQLISKLPNANRPEPIGLPGEQLYASRFIGNRAYIVTFRITDPLYALDLSDPTDPKITGELKIDGYSEYLHPISEDLLLGVGKDALPSEQGVFGGDGRGAWYQGVKLSLIDVTDPSNPREADKIILGKRGTESTALFSHHGLTGLQVNDKYRVAIPVQFHSGLPQNSSNPPSVSTHYDYTHTGLYRFEVDINNQTIGAIPALVVNNASNQTNRGISNDRSVIINDDVFYLHNGDFWMQNWQGNNPVIGPK